MSHHSIYISGGARSGKSRFAQHLAEERAGPHFFLATAHAYDAEMADRIQRHKDDRDHRWTSIEAPYALADAIRAHGQKGATLLVDCITLWLTNHMLADNDVASQRDDLCDAIRSCPATLIIVSNEVGMGIVPENALARHFRDEAGRTNQQIAALCDEAFVTISGIPLRLR